MKKIREEGKVDTTEKKYYLLRDKVSDREIIVEKGGDVKLDLTFPISRGIIKLYRTGKVVREIKGD